MVRKEEVLAVLGLGAAAAAVTYAVCSWMEDRKKVSQWELYEESRRRYSEKAFEGMEVEWGGEGILSEIPSNYKVIKDTKPDLDDVVLEDAVMNDVREWMNNNREAGEDPDILEEGDAFVDEDQVYVGEGPDESLRFGEDGIPVFDQDMWDSEVGNIYLISKNEYMEKFNDHEKEQAVWFAKSGVLVNGDLEPLDVVDTVGPSAFTTLCKSPELAIFVSNRELKTDYELYMNDTATIDEAREEQGEL